MRNALTLIFACLLSVSALAKATTEQNPNLTILVDENLLLPLSKIARSYASKTNTPLTIVVKNADDAEKQIEQGLEAHALISANYPLITRLTEAGLTNVSSRTPIARTTLALVTASALSKQASIAKRISFAAMLAATPNVPVYANAPETLDGSRVNALLSKPDFSHALAGRLEVKANHDEIIESLRDGEGLGLMLASDAVEEKDLNVLALLPEDVSTPVVFDAVVLGSESMEAASRFTTYLRTREATQEMARFGFQPPAK